MLASTVGWIWIWSMSTVPAPIWLRKNASTYRTAEQIAADTGLSKVTVRWYLNYLIGTNEAESQVDYSTGGRPRVEYRSR